MILVTARQLGRLYAVLNDARGPASVSTGFRLNGADVRLLVVLFVASRLALALSIGLAYLANTSRLEIGFDDIFCNWDCDWYVGIAEHGYQTLRDAGGSGAANWAFFPLLPLAMSALTAITGLPAVYSGLMIAQVGWGLGLYLSFLFGRDLRGPGFGRHLAIVYAVWPFAIHASIPMTEALFVPLSIGVLVLARRGNWLLAALTVALISATRTVGVLMVLPIVWFAAHEFGLWRVLFLRPGTERVAIAIGAAGLGTGLFMLHLYGLTGDALAFSHNQVAWNRQFAWPWMMMIDELNPAIVSVNWLIANGLDLATGIAAAAMLVVLWRRGCRGEALFGAAALLVAFDSGIAASLPRYSGGLFPVMLTVALVADTPLWYLPVYTLLAAGQVSLGIAWGLEQFYVM